MSLVKTLVHWEIRHAFVGWDQLLRDLRFPCPARGLPPRGRILRVSAAHRRHRTLSMRASCLAAHPSKLPASLAQREDMIQPLSDAGVDSPAASIEKEKARQDRGKPAIRLRAPL